MKDGSKDDFLWLKISEFTLIIVHIAFKIFPFWGNRIFSTEYNFSFFGNNPSKKYADYD